MHSLPLSVLENLNKQNMPIGALYVVATPIGNIGDITLRALHVLSTVDVIACEDTRNTQAILARYSISKPLIAAHKYNERKVTESILSRLRFGERVALVSDAGTPAVSDPGARLVENVLKEGLRVIPIPGASATLSALSISGFISDYHHFFGFLPTNNPQKRKCLHSVKSLEGVSIFFEAPHRIKESLNILAEIFEDDRQIVIARELTKVFEEIRRCKISELSSFLSNLQEKGEFVILIDSPAKKASDEINDDAKRILKTLLEECSVHQATSLAAKITGKKKNSLYKCALRIQEERKKE